MRVRSQRWIVLAFALAMSAGLVAVAGQPPAPVLAPSRHSIKQPDGTLGEIAAGLAKASGIAISIPPTASRVKCPVNLHETSFWEVLEHVARETGMKVVLQEHGTKVALEPRGPSREVVAVSGPFRIAATQVVGREMLDLGVTFYEVHLLVNWEPRIPVFRIEAQPRITKILDDRGVGLSVPLPSASTYPTEALTDMKVKVQGLVRESKSIAVLAAEFRVTAAERMLAFRFDSLAKLPQSKTQDRVAATLKGVNRIDKFWELEMEVAYPEGHPVFESFEEQKWLRDNRMLLISPQGKPIEPESEEIAAHGRRIHATYRYPAAINPAANGWSLVYETPGPLVEVKVPFELRNIPLP
jgi:hypothetical protein